MSTIDTLDEKLLQLLGKDAKQSSEALAKKLKVSPATVRRRVRQLLRNDTLRIVGVGDPQRVGFPLAAVIAIDVIHGLLEPVLDELAGLPEVKWVSTATGRYDILVLAWFRSTNDLSDFMRKTLPHMEGIRDSETFVCLRVAKGRYQPLAFD